MADEVLENVEELEQAPETVEGEQEAPEEVEAAPDLVEELGGEDSAKNAKELWLSLTTTEEFKPDEFWQKIVDLSPARYKAIATDLFKQHPQAALKANGIDPRTVADYNNWVKAGRPSGQAKDDDVDIEELEASDSLRDQQLARLLRAEQANKAEGAKRAALQAQQDAQQQEAEAGQAFNEVSTGHEAAIDAELAKLKLGDDDLAKGALEAIKALAFYKFFGNKESSKPYWEAQQLITKDREYNLGKNKLAAIKNKQQTHTQQAVNFITDLLQAKRAAGPAKVQQTVRQNINPPATGASAPATAQAGNTNGNVVHFDPKSQLEKFRQIKAERGL